MTFDEQVAYHNELEKRFPEQNHYTYQHIQQVFKFAGERRNVLEYGCWKGDLAARTIQEFNVATWIGVELCDNAIENTKCIRPEFMYYRPKTFDWFNTKDCPDNIDIVIATHFIEHLSNDHFDELAVFTKGTDAKFVYFESPLLPDGQNWEGYLGTHKLLYGWNQVVLIMEKVGFRLEKTFQDGRLFISVD